MPRSFRPGALLLSGLLALPAPGCNPSGDATAASGTGPQAREAKSGHHPMDAGGLVVVDPADPAHPFAIELGQLGPQDRVTRNLRLVNREGRALTISSVQAGCSCTTAALRVLDSEGRVSAEGAGSGLSLVVPKGAQVDFHFEILAAQSPTKNSPKLVLVRFISDSKASPYQSMEIRFSVHEPITAAPATVWMRNVPQHGGGQGSTELTNVLLTGETIVGVAHCPAPLKATLDKTQRGAIDLWVLKVAIEPPVALGNQSYEIQLATTGPKGQGSGPPVLVPVQVDGVPDLAFWPDLLLLQNAKTGGLASAQTELSAHLPGQRLRITGYQLSGELAQSLQVVTQPLAPDESGRSARWQVTLTATGVLPKEPQAGVLTLEIDDPGNPRLEIRYFKHAG